MSTHEYEKTRAGATAFYNEHAAKVSLKPVKSFKDTATALGRAAAVAKLLAGGKAESTAPKEPAAPKEKKAKSKRMDDDKVIKVVTTENMKRKDSKAHAKYAKLVESDGKTVAEFKAKEGKTPSLDEEVGWPGIELRWALKKGHVKLVSA